MKAYFLTWIKLAVVLLVMILMGSLLLTAAYCLPTDGMRANIAESVDIFISEGTNHSLSEEYISQLDNYTDSIMIGKAIYPIEASPLIEAFSSHRQVCSEGYDPLMDLVHMFSDEYDCDTFVETYPTYWHGYLIFLKPALMFFSYGELRVFNAAIQFVLIAILLYVLVRRRLAPYIPAVLLLILLQGMDTTVRSLQYSSVFYVYIIGSIFLLLLWPRWKNTWKIPAFFLSLGACTSYLDFLTAPLLTYGIPVTLLLVLCSDNSLGDRLKVAVNAGFAWILGYAGMWLAKGLICSLLTDIDAFSYIFSSVVYRSSANLLGGTPITISSVIAWNLSDFISSRFMPLAVLYCAFLALLIIICTVKIRDIKYIWHNCCFLLICLAPFCWYLVLKNHSFVHHFYTYRELLITAFAGMCMLTCIYSKLKTAIHAKN